jgi:hypothetical protein
VLGGRRRVYAAREELDKALAQLTLADILRLRHHAWYWLASARHGYYRDQDDLVSDAVDRTLRGTRAVAAGLPKTGRPLRRDVPLMAHLCAVIKGLASDARNSNERKFMARDDHEVPERPDFSNPLDVLIAEQTLEELGKNEDLRDLMVGQAEGLTPAQIQQKYDMTAQEYDNVRHLMRRKLRESGGGGRR